MFPRCLPHALQIAAVSGWRNCRCLLAGEWQSQKCSPFFFFSGVPPALAPDELQARVPPKEVVREGSSQSAASKTRLSRAARGAEDALQSITLRAAALLCQGSSSAAQLLSRVARFLASHARSGPLGCGPKAQTFTRRISASPLPGCDLQVDFGTSSSSLRVKPNP